MELAYVGQEYAAWVPFFEERLKALPKESGLLFYSVYWNPSFNGKCTILNFVLGLRKSAGLTKGVGEALVQQVLKDAPANISPFTPNVLVFLGSSGPTL